MLIDTVGYEHLLLPDLEKYHFTTWYNWVVNHAYNVASYILEHDNPIQDGNHRRRGGWPNVPRDSSGSVSMRTL